MVSQFRAFTFECCGNDVVQRIFVHTCSFREAYMEGRTLKDVVVCMRGLGLTLEAVCKLNGHPGAGEYDLEQTAFDCAVDHIAFKYREYVTVAGGYAAARMRRMKGQHGDTNDVDFFVHGAHPSLPLGPHGLRDRRTPACFASELAGLMDKHAMFDDYYLDLPLEVVHSVPLTDNLSRKSRYLSVSEMDDLSNSCAICVDAVTRAEIRGIFAYVGEEKHLQERGPARGFLRSAYWLSGLSVSIDQIIVPVRRSPSVVQTFDLTCVSLFLVPYACLPGVQTKLSAFSGKAGCIKDAEDQRLRLRRNAAVRKDGVVLLAVERIAKYLSRGYTVDLSRGKVYNGA